jgi:DNA-binding CsgD family transcriptional regulator
MNQYNLTINPRSKWSKGARRAKISPRELEILICHSEGKDNEEIAEELDIKYQTVKNMLYAVTKKLEAKNNVQAMMNAISENIINVTMPDTGNFENKIQRVVESLQDNSSEIDDIKSIANGIKKLIRRGKKDDR